MTKLTAPLSQVIDDLVNLVDDLTSTSERHAADHDIFHMGRLLSSLCSDLVGELKSFAEQHGSRLSRHVVRSAGRSVGRGTDPGGSAALDRFENTGSQLLSDLRNVLLGAQQAAIDCTILYQGALALRDEALSRLSEKGAAETERVVQWLKSRIKEAAPQILAG
jgi:hypothetical protein